MLRVLKSTVAWDANDLALLSRLLHGAGGADGGGQAVSQRSRSPRVEERPRPQDRKERRGPVIQDGLIVHNNVVVPEGAAKQFQCRISIRLQSLKPRIF